MRQRLRVFVSSPGDVKAAREIAALTIERLAQDYARFFTIEPYLWEFEAMVASGHFQDSIEPPSAFDVVIMILWSRLGTLLPERTSVREYRGIDGRAPVTGTEWEFEEAFQAAKQKGAPDLLVYRSLKPAPFDTHDTDHFEQQSSQLRALNGFWERHFANRGLFLGAFTLFNNDAEFATLLESHLRKLIETRIAALRGPSGDAAAKSWVQAPFRGLESYEFEHAPIFFGQDEALAQAMLRITARAESGSPFLLVLGASGSGKSSLVKAGILPKLFVPRRVPGVAFLRWVVFRPSDTQPGEDLFDALARRLTTRVSEDQGLPELIGQGQSLASLAAHFRSAGSAPVYPLETALGLLTAQARRAGRMLEHEVPKLVLVIDQLEELFNNQLLAVDERRRFIELLASLARSGHAWVLATMRKDFWHRADETPELVRLSQDTGRLELLPPGPAQISQMIRRPAEAAGIVFEAHQISNVPLNETIAEEVAREPGALPLLSYLLDQLYRIDILEARGNVFTYATYESLGKLEGAIATQAESVLQRCAPEDRAALSSVLFSLVDMSTATGDVERAVARRIPLSTFSAGSHQRRLINALLDSDARLLVSDSEKQGIPTVRIAHEALISRWARAREFVQGNAEALKIRRRIEERFQLWRQRGAERPEGTPAGSWTARFSREQALLTDIDLSDGRRLLKDHRSETEPHLIDYIERSLADNRRMRSRTLRWVSVIAVIVTILAIVASAAGWIASRKQHEAEDQTQKTLQAQARLLTQAAAQRLKDSDTASAQDIIVEVLTNPLFAQGHTPGALSVFQDVRAGDAELAVLAGHGDMVASAAFSPDGTHIVSASRDKTIRIWDARTGLQLAVMQGHNDRVIFAAYSRDGTRIVSASRDKTARVWDAAAAAPLLVLKGHDAAVTGADFSPDGSRIVTSSVDKTARIWDARTGAQIHVLQGHGSVLTSAAFSPDGTRILTASNDKTARIWDARTGAALSVLSGHEKAVTSAVYSSDGGHIATSSNDGTVRIWDARTGAMLAKLGLPGEFNAVAFSPDGSRVITSSVDRTARIWDVQTGEQLAVLSGHGDAVNTAMYSPDGTRIVTASTDSTVRVWDASDDASLKKLTGHTDAVETGVFSPDGSRVLTASADHTARVWNALTGELLTTLAAGSDPIQAAAYSTDGTRIVTASKDKTARIWDAHTGAQLTVLAGHTDSVNSAAFSPDGTRVVTSSFDKTARIWDAHSGEHLLTLSGHGGTVNTVAFSPDGSRILTASFDRTARIWDAHTGVQLAVLSGHADSVESAAFSPDGSRVVTASQDFTARIWDAHTGSQLLELSGHHQSLNSAAFSPDGTRVVTGGNDTIRIWDARTGDQLAALPDHRGFAVFSTAYSPDGTRIVSADYAKVARIWDARTPATLASQILWDAAAETDPLPDADRAELGLPRSSAHSTLRVHPSACDLAAAAYYDPDRLTSGIAQNGIAVDLANSSCAAEVKASDHPPRIDYQFGRALLAKGDVQAARKQFELAATRGYRVANLDLALALERSQGDRARAGALLEQAWKEGVPIAAYELGQWYESGPNPDAAKAWLWYERGADAGEPTALARVAERDERKALTQGDLARGNALLLQAFAGYAAASGHAEQQAWPDAAWKAWRYRRATLARLLAREGLMQKAADAYRSVFNQNR